MTALGEMNSRLCQILPVRSTVLALLPHSDVITIQTFFGFEQLFLIMRIAVNAGSVAEQIRNSWVWKTFLFVPSTDTIAVETAAKLARVTATSIIPKLTAPARRLLIYTLAVTGLKLILMARYGIVSKTLLTLLNIPLLLGYLLKLKQEFRGGTHLPSPTGWAIVLAIVIIAL